LAGQQDRPLGAALTPFPGQVTAFCAAWLSLTMFAWSPETSAARNLASAGGGSPALQEQREAGSLRILNLRRLIGEEVDLASNL